MGQACKPSIRMIDGFKRRGHPRADVVASVILLVRHNPGVAFTIESISLSGVRLAGPLTLQVGEHVRLLFEVEGAPIDVEGEVVRVVRPDIMTDRVAIAFRNLSGTTRALIQQLVQKSLDVESEE